MEASLTDDVLYACPCGFDAPHEIPEVLRDPVILAVKQGDTIMLKKLLLKGGVLRQEVCICAHGSTTLLHIAPTAAMVRELVSMGISANVVDTAGRTPLHRAVECNRPIDFLRELLKYGVDVNKLDSMNNTALCIELHKSVPNLDVLKLLLDCGALFDGRWRDPTTPLHCGLMQLALSNRYIKMFMLHHYEEGYFVYSESLRRKFFFPGVYEYTQSCIQEILLMMVHKVKRNLSLRDVMLSEKIISIGEEEADKIVEVLDEKYPVYKDMIYEKIRDCVERDKMLVNLSYTNVITCSIDTNGEERVVQLNPDCLYHIAGYLDNNDLRSFVEAFDTTE